MMGPLSVTETRTTATTRPAARPADPSDDGTVDGTSGGSASRVDSASAHTRGGAAATTDGLPTDSDADGKAGRAELGAFLRSRRERLTPEDVGLAPGLRRRTPGLRREEVAQLAGVGVTWYTWLEQGRAINASVTVLDAVAGTLRLDAAERAHLYRLAGVPAIPDPDDGSPLEPEIQAVLDGLHPNPAGIYNTRYDLLAWNQAYAALFPRMVQAPVAERNALWQIFTAPSCCCGFVNRGTEMPRMVATLRGAFGGHIGEPAWTDFVHRLAAASPDFAAMWAGHEVAEPGTRHKVFRHPTAGEVHMVATTFALVSTPETRLHVYMPEDDESRSRMDWLVAHPEPILCQRCQT